MMKLFVWSENWELEEELYKLILKGVSTIALLMSAFDFFFSHKLLAYIEFSFALVSILLLFCALRCAMRYVLSSRIFILSMSIPIYWNLLFNPSSIESTILFIFLPIITIILRPIREVIFFAVIFGGSFLFISFAGIGEADFSSMELFKLISMQGLISFFVVMYVQANKNYQDVISKQSAELKKSNTKLEELYKEKTIEASTDMLTGLNNRLALMRKLNELFALYRRNRETFSFIIFDIDRFKQVNDTYGHAKGDEVLQSVSKISLESVREIDMVARYGGEEFVVLLPNTGIEKAKTIAERMRKSIEDKVKIDGKSVTASFGVIQMRDDISVDELIRLADQALYRAKEDGRNTIALAEV